MEDLITEDLSFLPFFSISNNDELLCTIWNDSFIDPLNVTYTQELLLEPLDDPITDLQNNFKSYSCRYITMDELVNNEINTSSFSISQINTRSIKRNFDSFRSYLANFKLPPQVLTLSETWLKKGEEVYYNLPNYNFVSLPRENKQGGGVGIYIYYDLPYVIRHDLMNIMKDECEYIVIELILINNVPVLITSLYRPPNTDLNKFNVSFKNFLRIITNDAKRHRKRILIAGDTNIDLLKHINHPGTDDFLNELMAFGFLPSVTRPTRITEATATLIDNIFTNFHENITSSLIAYDDISDHFPIIVNISLSQVDHKPNIESTFSRTYNKKNFDDFHT